MAEKAEEPPISLKVRAEKIVNAQLPVIDCNMMDARSRKIMIYLVEKELKTLKTFPTKWVAPSIRDLEGLKQGLQLCTEIRKRKSEENTEQGTGATEESGTST